MLAKSPEDICRIFKQAMAEGDLELVLSIYDPEGVFLNESGEVTNGRDELKQQLAPRAAMKTRFDYDITQVVQTGDIALMHTEWTVSGPQQQQQKVHAVEIARRQHDGTWRWLIGDPFTVGKRLAA
jgi:uncharacterized protein (TIGR02246 family)